MFDVESFGLAVGAGSMYGATPRMYGYITKLGKVTQEEVVGRIYRILEHFHEDRGPTCRVEPWEGGDSFIIGLDMLHGMSKMLPVQAQDPSGTAQLRCVDGIDIGEERISLYLTDESAEELPENRRALAAQGLVCGREYKVLDWPIPEKAVTLEGVTGVYYAGLFEFV